MGSKHAMFELIKCRKQAILGIVGRKMGIYLWALILFSCIALIQNPHDLLGTKRVLLRRAYSPLAPNRPTFRELARPILQKKSFFRVSLRGFGLAGSL